MKSNYELLRNKEILEILDGDKDFGTFNEIKIGMPYLSGPMICGLSETFGLHQSYSWEKGFSNLSRWQYMDNLLEYAIKENKAGQLLSYMLQKERFQDSLKKLGNTQEIEETYDYITKKIIEQINTILYFGANELSLVGGQYVVIKIDSKVKIEAPNLKIIDREYIRDLSKRANKDIDEDNLDSAVTKARTILEETFCYVIEKKNEIPNDSGDISKLYKQVKDLYNMHADKNMDTRINKLLSGLEKIVSGIAEMRNNGSDSHGLGNKRIKISAYHARLAVNSATIMAEFILSVAQEQNN